MRYDVEVETEPIENFTLPVATAVDRLAGALRADRALVDADAAGHSTERTVTASGAADGESASAALQHFLERLEHHFQRGGLGPLRTRAVRCTPQGRPAGEPAPPPEPEHTVTTRHVSLGHWPPQFTSRHATAAPPAADTARLWAEAHALAHELRGHGHPDHARALEHALRPGRPIAESVLHLRHELMQLRMSEVPVLFDMEREIDGLIAMASRTLGAPAPR